MKHLLAIIIVGAGLAAGGPAGADEIHLVGTPIALKRCSVEGFSGGGVDYRDARGRRTNRPLEDVRAIGFDGLDVLDEAEAALREGDMELGERLLLRALLEAPSNVARTWCHARLARVHDRQGEYLACVRHAAEVWRMSPDPSWKSLRPLRAPDPDGHAESYAVAVEAVDALNRARRSLEQRTLHDLADALLETVRPMHARLRAAHDGPRPDPTLTMSGVAIEAILADELPEGIPASEPVRSPPLARRCSLQASRRVERDRPRRSSACSRAAASTRRSPPAAPLRRIRATVPSTGCCISTVQRCSVPVIIAGPP
ncbi:MAG: hypothetical protein ACYTGR_07255 [Planctomycetota bacterium]|jgi:hypothetical protein